MDVIAVDDDHAGRELLRMILEAAGHAVRTSPTSVAAIALVDTPTVTSVVVTDLTMGGSGEGGYELISAIRSNPSFDHVAVVAVTGVTNSRDLARARAIGADACVAKPLDVAHLLEVLEEVTRSRSRMTGAG